MSTIAIMSPDDLTLLVKQAVRQEVGAIIRDMHQASDVLTEKEAAKYLKKSPATLRNWRIHSKGPIYLKGEFSVSYLKKDLDIWLSKQRTLTSRN